MTPTIGIGHLHHAVPAAQRTKDPQGWSSTHPRAVRALGTMLLMVAAAAGCTAQPASVQEHAPEDVRAPDYVLALESVGADEPTDPHGVLDLLGLRTDELQRYEDFRSVSVWGGETRNGTSCLLVAHLDQGFREGLSADECSPDGSDAVVDLVHEVFRARRDVLGRFRLRRPTIGSVIRFVHTGDHVNVYVTATTDGVHR